MALTPEKFARKNGWENLGQSRGQSHRHFEMVDEMGVRHRIIIGAGRSHNSAHIDLDMFKKRDRKCKAGKCRHTIEHLKRTGQIEQVA